MENLFDIKGKVVVMTGACGVLGATIVKYFAAQGAKVALLDLDRASEKGEGIVAEIKAEGGESCFLPTVFYVSVDQDLLTAYAEGYLVTALRAVLADENFNNFLLRQLQRNIAPRMIVTIIEESLKKSMAIGTLNSPDAMRKALDDTMQGISNTLEDLEPEDAIITTDAVGYKLSGPGENSGGAGGIGTMLKTIHDQLQNRLTASLKTLPAVLGRDSGQGSATVSAYLFLKSAEVLALKLGVIYSRMLTRWYVKA
jgi:hypothetical protein